MGPLETLRDQWRDSWEGALDVWSSYTKLSMPRWCLTQEEELAEGLTGSFAMIRLVDHAVVISLRQVMNKNLGGFAREILAHEIGHHVYAPGDLSDNARLLAKTRAGLPGHEPMAPMIANLYTDLLINNLLQRSAKLDMAGVYGALKEPTQNPLWVFYMHTYEILWGLPSTSLFAGELDDRIRADAILAARLVRNYGGDWLSGAGRFAVLCRDYLSDEPEKVSVVFGPWLDAAEAGAGDDIPEGLTGMSAEEVEGPRHPALDGAKAGEEGQEVEAGYSATAKVGGKKTHKRSPSDYVELMKSLGVKISQQALIINYYRELARPHLAPFPFRGEAPTTEPQIEGVQKWEPGAPLSSIDWLETALRSPIVIPGVTTVERVIGETSGDNRKARPADLYLGIDCSGSMRNPAFQTSFPVLAGAVVSMSALRAGAKVKTVLSGSPGKHTETERYSSSLRKNLNVLTGYLGTGYAFGLDRLDEEFLKGEPPEHPVHILIITDTDIFAMLDDYEDGWEVARRAMERARGGVTCVLEMGDYSRDHFEQPYRRLKELGWDLHSVTNQEELVIFARAFSRQKFTIEMGEKR